MEKSSPIKEKQKKPYSKPRLRQVDLRPEEAVLGGCKTGGTGGPAGVDCVLAGCSSIAS